MRDSTPSGCQLRDVMAANVGPPSSSLMPLRSMSTPVGPGVNLFGGQAVVKPVAWQLPSDHSVWPKRYSRQPPLYSGAIVSGSAVGGGTLFGLLIRLKPTLSQIKTG